MGCVYIIGPKGEGCLKIGISDSPYKRLASLQTASPVRLEIKRIWDCNYVEPRKVEQRAHASLKEQRAQGEWFDITLEAAEAAVKDAISAEVRCVSALEISKMLASKDPFIKGMPASKAVLAKMYLHDKPMHYRQLAQELDLEPGHVRVVLHRLASRKYLVAVPGCRGFYELGPA